MPNVIDIKTAVENGLIRDEFIKGSKFEYDSRGRLLSYVGGFTSVYPVIVNGEKWAFRCWHTDLGNVRRRFELLAKAISKSKLAYLCDFKYTDEGIVVDGKIYPTTRMRWIEGKDIKTYVCDNKNNKRLLQELAANFLKMCKDLHLNNIAHGDLQHGNIIIDSNNQVFLIDYDSLYCPEIIGSTDIITGLKNYQHPKRKENKISSEKLDYFSELIIYTSILGIAEQPNLVNKYQVLDSEKLLFEFSDFENFKNSMIHTDLSAFGGNFPLLLKVLEHYLSKSSIGDMEPFDFVLDRMSIPPIIRQFKSDIGDTVLKNKIMRLTWTVDHYSQIFINDDIVTTNYYETSMKINTKFVLKVVNGLKEAISNVFVNVVENPTISLKLEHSKIRRGKQNTNLNWVVKNAHEITLIEDGREIHKCKPKGSIKVAPTNTTKYELRVVALDKSTVFTESATLSVFDESDISFNSDKQYVFPGIPIILSWSVKNALSVELVGIGKVENEGSHIVETNISRSYDLKVEDNFSTRVEKVEIAMLPLPLIKSIVIPSPSIHSNSEFTIYSPSWEKYQFQTKDFFIETPVFPKINIQKVDLSINFNEFEISKSLENHKIEPKGWKIGKIEK